MPDTTRKRILVVDDDLITRMVIADALSDGFEVQEAESGEEALEQFPALAPDLVLLDVMMGGIDGFSVCRTLRERPDCGTLPVVMLTSLDDVDSIERAFAVGASDFLAKPINPTLLRHWLRYRLRAHETLRSLDLRERQLAAAQRIARLAHWEFFPQRSTFQLSPAACRLLGLAEGAGEYQLEAVLQQVPDADRAQVKTRFERLGLSPTAEPVRFEHRLGDGRQVLAQTAEFHDDDGGYWLGTVQDVTQQHRSAQRITRLAYYDASTSLPNRAFFREYLERLLSQHPGVALSVLMLELDVLRRVGAGWGDAVTEPLLRDLAARLVADLAFAMPATPLQAPSEWSRDERPMLARVGEGGFAILPRASGDAAVTLARRLLARLNQPVQVAGIELLVHANVGIAHTHRGDVEPDTLLRCADAAAHAARAEPSGLRVYEQALDRGERKRMTMEARLRRAIDEHALELWYQPKVDARDGRIIGAEGLVRWCDPANGLVSPAEFIPVAEETGLIVPLSEQVLDLACNDLALIDERGLQPVCISVNISAAQLDHEAFASEIGERLRRTGVASAYLELEITERALMPRAERITGMLEALHGLGVTISLDDFGTGYSSLGYLGRFPLDILKIDRSFVTELGAGGAGETVVRSIVALAKGLGLKVVAEGVETAAQADWLRANGCPLHQGFYYARPLQREAFLARLEPATAARCQD